MFAFSQWNLPWSSRVFAVDSSLTGFGIASSDWSLQDVKDVGRVGERGRFRFLGVGARSHAFQVAGFAVNTDGKIMMDDAGKPVPLDTAELDQALSLDWEKDPDILKSLLTFWRHQNGTMS